MKTPLLVVGITVGSLLFTSCGAGEPVSERAPLVPEVRLPQYLGALIFEGGLSKDSLGELSPIAWGWRQAFCLKNTEGVRLRSEAVLDFAGTIGPAPFRRYSDGDRVFRTEELREVALTLYYSAEVGETPLGAPVVEMQVDSDQQIEVDGAGSGQPWNTWAVFENASPASYSLFDREGVEAGVRDYVSSRLIDWFSSRDDVELLARCERLELESFLVLNSDRN